MTDCLVSRRGKHTHEHTHKLVMPEGSSASLDKHEVTEIKELCLRSLQMETGSWFLLLNQRMI